MKTNNFMTIGMVAAQTGLRTSAIRYYESIGILPVPPRSGGQRRYNPDIIKRIGCIQTAQQAGFSIEQMKFLLNIPTTAQPYAERVQALARQKLAEVEAVIEQAKQMKRILQAGLSCGCGSADDCSLFTGIIHNDTHTHQA